MYLKNVRSLVILALGASGLAAKHSGGLGSNLYNSKVVLIPIQACCPGAFVVQSSFVDLSPPPARAQYIGVIPRDESFVIMRIESPTAIRGPHDLRRNSWSVTCRLSEIEFFGPSHPVWLPYTLARPLLSTNAIQGHCGMMQEALWRRREDFCVPSWS